MRQITEVISTKRSAHHAFILWYCQNARRPVAFFNNIILSLPPRLRELERFGGGGPGVVAKGSDHLEELRSGTTDVLMNIEGKSPSSIARWNDRYLRRHVTDRLVRVVFLRDPVNTLASLAKRCRSREFRSLFKYFNQVIALQQIIGQLDGGQAGYCDRVVLMSPWLRDQAYREEVARYLDLNPGEPPLEVTRQGGGSSFGGRSYDPATESAALHERWRDVESSPLFLAPFADDQVVDALRTYYRLFGAFEALDPAVVDSLQRRAAVDPAAAGYVRRMLAPMRRAGALLDAMELAPQQGLRKLWKSLAVARIALRL